MSRTRAGFDLFLISALILFLELACIRWFPAHVVFLTFFTNTVLLACFVGMSIGCLTARSPRRHLYITPLLITCSLAIGLALNFYGNSLRKYVDVAGQAKPDVVFFGAETSVYRSAEFLVPVEVVAGGMFLLIASLMVGPGQEMGRAFNRVPERVRAYTLNILGSLVGIALFAACSWFQLSPVVWFGLVAAGLLYFLTRPGEAGTPRQSVVFPVFCLFCIVALSVRTSGQNFFPDANLDTKWSPYYRVDYHKVNGAVVTNQIGHQIMMTREKEGEVAYHLPYLFNRATNQPQFKRILVIGAGSGNDVSRALLWADPNVKIDAVDIEPVIQDIGRRDHPDQPYSDPRVTAHLDDGRNFLRRAPSGEYDLVVYALVDSLVLHSGYGNIRLESYLFTRQAFQDVKRVMKPEGGFAVYNYFRNGWVVARLRDALQDTFATEPVALTDPPLDSLKLDEMRSVHTFFYAGGEGRVAPLRKLFTENANKYWVPVNTAVTKETPCRFGPEPVATEPGTKWSALRMIDLEASGGDVAPATDEWPFFYTRRPMIPSYLLRGIGMMVGLAGVLWLVFRPRGLSMDAAAQPSEKGLLLRMFFLGAGFMLVETKAIVHMALLFGSTWMVNTVVFFALLSTALVANLFVSWLRPKNLTFAYAGLLVALGANLAVPLDAFLGMDRVTQILASCALVFAPIFFAGTIFSTSFQRSAAPDRAFGANVAGALLGGMSENVSMLLGFQLLLVVAVGYYLISGFGNKKAVPDGGVDPVGI